MPLQVIDFQFITLCDITYSLRDYIANPSASFHPIFATSLF